MAVAELVAAMLQKEDGQISGTGIAHLNLLDNELQCRCDSNVT